MTPPATPPPPRRPALTTPLAAAGLLAFALLLLGPGLLPGRTLLPLDILGLFEPWRGELPNPANPEVGDSVLQFGQREIKARALAGGAVPLWNASIMGGHPLAGDTHSAPFNPIELALLAALPSQRAYSLQVLLNLWLAGLFMALWMRQLGLGWFPALAAALTFMLAGHHQVLQSFIPFLGTPLWLPAAAAAWEHAARTGARRSWALGGLAAGMAILNGQVQFAVYGAVLLLAYALARLAGFDAGGRRRGVRAGIAIGGIGLAVGAIHLLPVAEMARDGIRTPLTLEALRATAVPLSQLVTAVAPRFLGDPLAGDYRGAQNFTELALYIGLVPLLVVLAAPWLRRDRGHPDLGHPDRSHQDPNRLNRDILLFALLAVVVTLLALGSPLAWPLAVIPGMQLFGLMRWLAVWPLVAAPLVALGLAAAPRSPRRFARLVLGLAAGLGGLLCIAAWRDPEGAATVAPALGWLILSAGALILWSRSPARPVRQALVLAVLAADLVAFGWGFTPPARLPAEGGFPRVPPLDRLAAERAAEVFRVAVFQEDRIALGPGVAPSVGLDEIGGYTSTPRASYRAFLERLSRPTGNGFLEQNANMLTTGQASPLLLALLNVRYVLSATPLGAYDLPIDPEDDCIETQVLAPGQSVGALLAPWADGLNRLDIAVPNGGSVAVHLVAAPGAPEHLVYGELAAGEGPVRTLYFEPIAGSSGRTFYAYVDLPAGASGPPPEVCVQNGVLTVGSGAAEPAYPLAYETGGLYVYRAPEPPGRAWIVPAARAVPDLAAALDAVAAAGFDPRAEVVIESGQEGAAEQAGSAGQPAPGSIRVTVTDAGPNARRIALDPPAGGWLVVSEGFAPGWHATVDGQSAPVLRADGGIQAIPLPPGSGEVELVYRPWTVVVGAAVALAGLLIALGLAVWRTGMGEGA
jgi:hypothetical protein